MKTRFFRFVMLLCSTVMVGAFAATTVPNEAKMPGTQPNEVQAVDSSQCALCHGGYNTAVEPYFNWRGSMMAHAGEDPLFWANVALAEQTYDGSGDLCIRCHLPGAWVNGRSTPTNGSNITANDAWNGVQCAQCHRLTNPDRSEWIGTQNTPFIAKTGSEGHYGSGQYVLWWDTTRFGPYKDAAPPHLTKPSKFHRSSNLCGTCHDVSNPVVGDLAPGNGAQQPLASDKYSGVVGSALGTKAAFNNPPYKYGIVERTFSEHIASAFDTLKVSDYNSLPADLKAGAIKKARDMATANIASGNYADGTVRNFTCQTCHMPPVRGQGSWIGGLTRNDLPLHNLTGGNYWAPVAIQYMNDNGTARFANTVSAGDKTAMNAGILRAKDNLNNAASLSVTGNTVKVVNLTGHKLISGYPEGRRMWFNVKWYNSSNALVREDGAYGNMQVTIAGQTRTVRSLLNLSDTNTKVYEAHGSITKEWASKLLSLGKSPSTPVTFDRSTGAVTSTLGSVASQGAGTFQESFHFVLNNFLAYDNRIPPYGMKFDEAKARNALPVPNNQFGNPGAGGTYQYWDTLSLNPPTNAVRATISLMYQPTSWEYIQFLYLANNGSIGSLQNVGINLRDAWLNTGMAEPYVMTAANWTR